MKRASLSYIGTVIVILVFGGRMSSIASAASADNAAKPASVEKGHTLFMANCAVCHGADGRGSALGKGLGARSLPSAGVQSQSDAILIHTILDGKDKMPPFKEMLNHSQTIDLVQYVRTLGKSNQ